MEYFPKEKEHIKLLTWDSSYEGRVSAWSPSFAGFEKKFWFLVTFWSTVPVFYFDSIIRGLYIWRHLLDFDPLQLCYLLLLKISHPCSPRVQYQVAQAAVASHRPAFITLQEGLVKSEREDTGLRPRAHGKNLISSKSSWEQNIVHRNHLLNQTTFMNS